jgi:TPR repeat protein
MKPTRALAMIGCLGLFALSGQDFAAGLKAYENHDYATALKEWRPLAEKGSAAAEFNLGLLYYDGRGVSQDFTEAVQWFERSADQGYAKAQYNLGEMYAVGKGVKRDYVQSYKWLSVCAASGNDTCGQHRDLVEKKLKNSQLSTARRLAQEWKPRTSS